MDAADSAPGSVAGDSVEEDGEPVDGEQESGEWRSVSRSGAAAVELLQREGAKEDTFWLRRDIYERLYGYQRDGVAWMARLWQNHQGGILADEMGLGKTVQVCSLLNGARKSGATHALLLLPVTLLDQWSREARIWCPGWPVHIYYGTAPQKAKALRGIMRPTGGILLTSYQLLSNIEELMQLTIDDAPSPKRKGRAPLAWGERRPPAGTAKRKRLDDDDAEDGADSDEAAQEVEIPSQGLKTSGSTVPWDIVVCDEAHRMKNISTLLGKSLRRLNSKCRLLLTGTPVQNALQDLWALMDFAQPGLLGNHSTFVKTFSDPIDRGSVRGAKVWAVELKKHLSEQLRSLISPHILRRTKLSTGLLQDEDADEDMEGEATGGDSCDVTRLPPKKDTILWLAPSEEQTQAYQRVLEKSEVIREACSKQKLGIEVFRAIGLLKRLCNHPALLLPTGKPGVWPELLKEAMSGEDVAPDAQEEQQALLASDGADESLAVGGGTGAVQDDARGGRAVEMMLRKLPRSIESLKQQSSKLRCLSSLLPALAERGHRTLVFSQSVKMLDLIQICCLKPSGLRCLRIDGQTDPVSRAEKVAKFQKERERFQCMLLTTSVGGVGLNLTSADRVILVDPAWNPAIDAQAVDRAFRIGQDKEVRVYRLIMSGLIEDKMFRLQVFKMGLTKTALEADQKHNYFTAREIRALFDWTDPAEGETRKLLQEKHGKEGDAVVQGAAAEDGAQEGWLEAGPSVGLSDFASLYGTVAQEEEEEQDDASAALVAEAKEKLSAADSKLQNASEARQQAEAERDRVARELEEMIAACELVREKRAATEETLREKRSALAQARKLEATAQQRLDKAGRGRVSAQDSFLRVQQGTASSNEAASLAATAASEAAAAARAAEEAFLKAVTDAEAQLAVVGLGGKAISGGAVESKADAVRKAQRALEKVRSSLDTIGTRQADVDSTDEELARADRGHSEAHHAATKLGVGKDRDGDDAMAGTADAQAAIAKKGAELTLKNREKERQRAEQAQGKAQQKAEAARESMAASVQAVTEAGMAFAESFQKVQAKTVKMDQVKAAQAAAKAAFRQLTSSWAAVKRARDGAIKAMVLRRKAMQKAGAALVSEAETGTWVADAEREYSEAATDEEARRAERGECEAALATAEAARQAAEAEEADTKRKKDELKAEVPQTKESVRLARAAERDATNERHSLHTACSKVERENNKLEEAKNSAVQMLKEEEYDPNQVEKAYDKKNEGD